MKARGFTLVEVMVALAVVAVALPALLMSLYQQMDNTAYLRDKSEAHMVAANKLEEARIKVGATRAIKAGKDAGVIQFAERDWYWWQVVATTEVPQFFRVEIGVGQEESQQDRPLYTLVAFISGDLQIDSDPPDDSDFGEDPEDGSNPDPDPAREPGTPPEPVDSRASPKVPPVDIDELRRRMNGGQ